MKTYLSILAACILILTSCGSENGTSVEDAIENGDLATLRAKRKEVVAQQKEAAEKLKQLDNAIASMDSVQKLPLVTTIKVRDTLFNHYLELQGNVETKKNIVVYPEFSGTLTKVYVKEGQRVRRGQILARVDDGGLSQQLAQMEVQEALAKTTYERQQKLWDQKIGSEIQYLQAKANYEAQQNAIAQMQQQLGKSTINAPFSGIVDDVIAEQGSVVAAGQTSILRIVNLDNMYIQAEVPESYIKTITTGKEAKVYFPVLDTTIITKIRQVGNYINPNNRSFTVEVDIPNRDGEIKPNLTARVMINDYTSKNAVLVPQSILSENANGEQYTYVTKSTDKANIAEAQRVIVKTGKTQGDVIEITEGIQPGDEVISEGARSVKDGQQVEIIKDAI